ncbi:MAG: 50S ribosomal protein L25 [Spirochaetaceae bacterium]|nr:50S ribosomal protein L25 [Myxococcales bacterium]MCB9723400.1 50S ribosomal protein L25 [Spirochaetaceae bacterium]
MGDVTFSVEAREGRGKGASRKLRQRGLVPGVVYGGGREATPIALDVAQFERLIETSHGGINTLIDLAGSSPAAGRTVIAKELQREAVRGRITHVDFYEVDLKTKIEVEVPIHLVGTPEGVTLGGVLDQQLREILLMCLPGSIPDDIQADVSGLALGDSLHVADLQVPAGVEIHSEPTLTVATVLVPRGLKDAGEEGAEGEAPATEAAPAS